MEIINILIPFFIWSFHVQNNRRGKILLTENSNAQNARDFRPNLHVTREQQQNDHSKMGSSVAELFTEIDKLRVQLLINVEALTDCQRVDEETNK